MRKRSAALATRWRAMSSARGIEMLWDFTQEEIDRAMVRNAEAAAQSISGGSPEKPERRGRKPAGKISKKKAAEAVGTSERTLRHAERHVSDLDAYPFMPDKGWKRVQAATLHDLRAVELVGIARPPPSPEFSG